MKFTLLALLFCAVLLPLSSAGHANSAGVRKEMQADYDKISAAETSLNPDTFAQAVTAAAEPSSTWIAQNGTAISLTQYLALRKKAMQEIKSITTDNYTVLSVKVGGDTATSRTHALISGTETDRAGTYGVASGTHLVSIDRLYEASWVKYAAGWKIHSVRVISSQLTVDGKVIVPPAPTALPRTPRRRNSPSR